MANCARTRQSLLCGPAVKHLLLSQLNFCRDTTSDALSAQLSFILHQRIVFNRFCRVGHFSRSPGTSRVASPGSPCVTGRRGPRRPAHRPARRTARSSARPHTGFTLAASPVASLHAVHTGSMSVMEHCAQIVREMVHTHFNSAEHSHWFLESRWKGFGSKRKNRLSQMQSWMMFYGSRKQCEQGVMEVNATKATH